MIIVCKVTNEVPHSGVEVSTVTSQQGGLNPGLGLGCLCNHQKENTKRYPWQHRRIKFMWISQKATGKCPVVVDQERTL